MSNDPLLPNEQPEPRPSVPSVSQRETTGERIHDGEPNGAAGAAPPGDNGGRVVFDESDGGLFPLAVKGYLLTLVTLGIYRFWYITDLRRFFWSRTIVHGSPLEYTGRGMEIFIGFLIALAVLVPIYVLMFAIALDRNLLGPVAPVIGLLLFGFLGLFAYYRSRRYRVNRTLWRGLRMHQSGSGWGYAFRAAGWAIAGLFTLGIVVPWAEADLYRYRTERMHFGTTPFSFHGSWRSIAKPYFILWAVFALPLVAALVNLAFADVDWLAFRNAWTEGADGALTLDPDRLRDGDAPAFIPVLGALFWMFLAYLSMPYYYARRTSAFFSATRLSGVGCTARVRARSLYGIYVLFFLIVSLVAGVMAPLAMASIFAIARAIGNASGSEAVTAVGFGLAGVIAVATMFVVVGVMSVLFLQRKIWELVAESVTLHDPARLDELAGRMKDTETGFGAGFADALDVGDFEVGL